MKKLMIVLLFLLTLPLALLAQETPPPKDWLDLIANFNVWLGTLAGVAAVTVFIAAVVNNLLKSVGFWKQVVAWAVAVLLLILGNLLNVGFMANLSWLATVIYGVAAGFIANGIFDITLVQNILKALKLE